MARLDRAGPRSRRHRPSARAGRDDRAAAAPAAARQAARDARPAGRGPPRGPADGVVAEDEYQALGVPFGQRGAILDEQLAAMARAWKRSPASFEGEHFLSTTSTSSRSRSGRRARGCGSAAVAARRAAAPDRRVRPRVPPVRHADARGARAASARRWPQPAATAPTGDGRRHPRPLRRRRRRRPTSRRRCGGARAARRGFTSICFKPSMYTDDPAEVGDLCRRLVAMARAAAR